MGDSLESNLSEPTVDHQNLVAVDLHLFLDYLRKIVLLLHPEDTNIPAGFNIAIEDKIIQESIKKFLSDSQVWVLYIQRISNKGKLF